MNEKERVELGAIAAELLGASEKPEYEGAFVEASRLRHYAARLQALADAQPEREDVVLEWEWVDTETNTDRWQAKYKAWTLRLTPYDKGECSLTLYFDGLDEFIGIFIDGATMQACKIEATRILNALLRGETL